MRRVGIAFLCSLLLWFIASQANHYLGPWQVSLFLGGLFVAYPALHMPTRSGGVAVLLAGLLCDAAAPVWVGTHPALFLAAFVAIRNMRDRLPREETSVRILVALVANLAMFLVLSFLRIPQFPEYTAAWLRLFADLIASQVALALVAPWYLSLHRRALVHTGSEAITMGTQTTNPWG